CETGFHPEGAFEAAYSNNRRDAIENIVEADPVAARVREIMADRAQWAGSLPIFCWPAPMLRATPWLGTALAGQRVPAHSPAGRVGHSPRFARLGLRSSSAARGGWERGPSG